MDTRANLKYTKEHEWVEQAGASLKVGISDYAQSELGDVVFVELPEVGRALTKGESFASVESVKAVSDIYAPVSGKISKINDKLSANPELINSSPFDDAWIIEIESANTAELSELMDQSQYDGYLKEISK